MRLLNTFAFALFSFLRYLAKAKEFNNPAKKNLRFSKFNLFIRTWRHANKSFLVDRYEASQALQAFGKCIAGQHHSHQHVALKQFIFVGWGQLFRRLNFLITFVRGDKDVAIIPHKNKLLKAQYVGGNGILRAFILTISKQPDRTSTPKTIKDINTLATLKVKFCPTARHTASTFKSRSMPPANQNF